MKLQPLKFENYDRRAKYYVFKLQNGALNIKYKSRNDLDSRVPKISGGILKGQYVLDNLHFHCDSEHIVYGKTYPVEAHFVHYRRSLGSMEEAKASKMAEAVAIISIMYEVSITECPKIGLFQSLNRLSATCCCFLESQFCLRDILPSYLRSYYTYKSCQCIGSPNTIWIIMTVPGMLTYWQYTQLMNVLNSKRNPTKELATKNPKFVINGSFITPEKPKSSPAPARNVMPSCCNPFSSCSSTYPQTTNTTSNGYHGIPATLTYPQMYGPTGDQTFVVQNVENQNIHLNNIYPNFVNQNAVDQNVVGKTHVDKNFVYLQ